MADYEFTAKLDDSQILAALAKIDNSINKIGQTGDSAFGKVSSGSKSGAAGLGVLTGATTAVVNKLLEMGQAATRAFTEIIKGSIDAAKTLETTEASLTGILGGDSSAALAAIDKIRQESIRLGVDLTELAPAFLPKVQDLEQFTKIGELVASLANLDPAQGAAGARLALSEALSGDVTSLRRRFEIDVTPIKEAQAEFGELEGLLIGLEEVLKSRGQDFATLADTAGATFNQTKQIAEDAKTTFGEPILDALKEDFQALNQFLLDNKDTIDVLAGSLGDLVADIADFAGDNFLNFTENIDLEKLQEFILGLQDGVARAQAFADVLGNFKTDNAQQSIGELLFSVENLNNVLETATKLLAIVQLGQFATSFDGIQQIEAGILSGDIKNFEDVLRLAEDQTGAIANATQALNDQNAAIAENHQRLQDRINDQNESNEADLAAANAALAAKQQLEAETKAAEEAASAQEKYNEARDDFEIDKSRAADDLALKQQRALLDAEIEFAQKREDLARKNAAAIEDIYRKNKQRISDAAIDLRRDEEDIARKGARSQIEIEREAANRRVEIETDFRRELQRIRERFDFDAQEAIRQNDAIAFLRIQRQKDFELSQAKQQRDEEIQDAETSAVEQRQKLQEQLQAQIEDARIANQRKLEDLRLSLQRELQEQQIKYAREVQEAKIAEQRKRDELARTFQRQQEDFQRFWDRKLQDLIRNYQKELQIIQQYEAQKAQIMAESRARAMLTSRSSLSTRDPNAPRDRANAPSRPTGDGVQIGLPSVPTGSNSGYTPQFHAGNPNASDPFERFNRTGPGRQFGGRAIKGLPYLVGERGAEAFVPDQNGTIYPHYRLKFNPTTAGAVNNITHTRQTNFNVDALMSVLSPQQIAIVQQLINQLGMSIYS